MLNRKFYSILLLVPLLTLSSCNNSYTIPTFEKATRPIQFTAYDGPTVKGARGNMVSNMTLENFQKIKDAGFNNVIAMYEGLYFPSESVPLEEAYPKSQAKATTDALQALNLCEQVGLKYYVRDSLFYGMFSENCYPYKKGVRDLDGYRDAMKNLISDDNQYIKSSAYAGNFGVDEPYTADLTRVKWQVQAYKERMAELGYPNAEILVNLLPITADASQISSYNEYIDNILTNVSPMTGYISYDFYPLTKGGGYKNYILRNLQLVADKLKTQEKEYEFRTFVQCGGNSVDTRLRDIASIADFRFQIYSNLAFGSTYISFFEYAGVTDASQSGFYLFNCMDNTYNWTYDLVKRVNNEVHNFEDALLSYKYDGVIYKDANELYPNQAFSKLVNPYKTHDRISINSCSEDTLLTTFKNKKNNDDAFMLMNYSDPLEQKNNTVTLHFNNAKALLMYRLGQRMIVDLPYSKTIDIELYPGEGRFIIPLS